MTSAVHPESLRRVISHFEQRGWKFELDLDDCRLRTGFKSHNGAYLVRAWIDGEDTLLQVVVRYPLNVPERYRARLSEFVCAATYGLKQGKFYLDVSDGEIGFHTAVPYVDHDLPEELIDYHCKMAFAVADKYWPGFEACLFEGEDPGKAIEQVEGSSMRQGIVSDAAADHPLLDEQSGLQQLRSALAAEFRLTPGEGDEKADPDKDDE